MENKTLTAVCAHCGKLFKKTPTDFKRRRFCSKECHYLACNTTIICKFCGKPFKAPASEAEYRKFCCKECKEKYQQPHSCIKYCKNCGKQFKVALSRIKIKQFCSAKCRKIFYIGKPFLSSVGKNRKYYFCTNEDGKLILYHRYVMEQRLGRKLKSYEIVHHIDHNHLNNAVDNLQIMTGSEHAKHHHHVNNFETWFICKYCKKPFLKIRRGHCYQFCSKSCHMHYRHSLK